VETIRCDLLDEAAVAQLPDAPLVVCGRPKVRITGLESLTWAMNTGCPPSCAAATPRHPHAAFSTGNVYGLSPVGRGGSTETDAVAPVGEYAMSCLGRERMFEHFSRSAGTRVSILRLNYATEMRYGLLVDLARKIAAGPPIDLSMGHANVIWQGDANAMSLVALAHAASPPYVVNIAGHDELSVREVCVALGARLGRRDLHRHRAGDALLSNGARGSRLGPPRRASRS
jgi:nucleoside-diphosphate-sugar epimerase